MRIALFHNQAAGGAKRVIIEHARKLLERGHALDAYIVSTATESYLPLAPLCEHVYTYDPPIVAPRRLAGLVRHPVLQKALQRLSMTLKEKASDLALVERYIGELAALELLYDQMAIDMNGRGYDVAYVHQCRTSNSPGLLRRLTFPSVYYCHDTLRYVHDWAFEEHEHYDTRSETWYWYKMKGNLVPRPMMRFLHILEQQYVAATRAATRVLCNSWFSREAICTTGTNPRVCYPGVDSECFCPDPAVPRERIILSVGTLAPNKRHDFIVEAISTIPHDRRPAMEIIGYENAYGEAELGPHARKLLRLAAERSVNLHISKEVADVALRDQYRRAVVFAFAPAMEPFGIVPLEAMACGTPVVGVSEGGLRETIKDGVTGFLTERDPVDFGAALDRLVSDPDLASRVGARGREEACSTWTWSRSAEQLEKHLGLAVAARDQLPVVDYGPGFLPRERGQDGSTWSWMGGEGLIRLRNSRRDMLLTVNGCTPGEVSRAPTICLEFNGEPLDQFVGTRGEVQRTYEISAKRQGSDGWSRLRITTSETFVPRKVNQESSDSRRLGFAVYDVLWVPK